MATPLNGSILKAFDILGLITRDRPEIGGATVQAELGMNAATAHRFLATLEAAGALYSVRRGSYRIGHRLAEIGRLADETAPYMHDIRDALDLLRDNLAESVMVCRLGREGPTCIAVAAADRPIKVSIQVGTTLSLTESAQGLLWLSEMTQEARARANARLAQPLDDAALAALEPNLKTVLAQGFARNAGHAEPDIGAIAVPVRDAAGSMVLTLSAFGPLGRFTAEFQDRALAQLRPAAQTIGRCFRH